ncbi:peptidoglycan DD-metalloendopeptidase family protein [Streptomyces sp. NPDC101118]|uniref:M23 family metallopeptidase n=1 Tax=Streptomyces sp. NPDC101118 TaxID=3366109 RepID=UPI003805DF82
MPGKGKHRRPKSSPITRGFVAAGTGGAALALPLMGASGAHAAGPAAAPQALPAQAPQAAHAAPAAVPAAVPQAAPVTYTVVAGDHLSKIASEHHLSGGWQKLYADNRAAVGGNPSLIHPGLELTLGAAAAPKAAEAPAKPAAAPKPAKKAPEKTQKKAVRKAEPKAVAEDTGADRSAATASRSTQRSTTAVSGAGFVAPVSGGISTSYRAGGGMWASGYHTGVDFSVGSGTTVRAVGAGTVVSAGWGGAYGNEVIIRHEDGRYSQYAHLSSLNVSAGQSVGAGDSIGLSGSTGNSTGPHLHFEIRTGPSYGDDIDPLAYLRDKGVSV